MASVVEAAVGAAALSEELATTAARLQASVVQVRTGRGGIGSGVIWERRPATGGAEPEVIVVTNEHVVRAAGNTNLSILVHDGRTLTAEVLDHDPEHDLALLRVRAEGLQPVEVGDSAALRVGELVIAVGNPFGKLNTLTVGIVAARAPADPDLPLEPADPDGEPTPSRERRSEGGPRERRSEGGPRERASRTPDLIQADVRLYPGNSGGPLADARGRAVGVNSMVGGGLAFAIPSRIVQQFTAMAGSPAGARPQLGVQVIDVELPDAVRARAQVRAESAVLVAGVEEGSLAAASGVIVGDIILAIDGRTVGSVRDLVYAVRTGTADGRRTLSLLRGGERRELTIIPTPRDAAA